MTEDARLDALHQLRLLDTPPSEAFDRITRMASLVFSLPIAAVSLTDLDRQWFKSRIGVSHTSIPRDKAPCAQVAERADRLVIPDLLADECYRDSPLARSGIRFYAGAPLVTRDGFGLGAMCVLGTEPRTAETSEMAALSDLAAMVMAQIELQHAFGRIDPQSGMPNRNQFIEDLEDLARDRPPHEQRLAVLVDIASARQLSGMLRVVGAAHFDDAIHEAARTVRAAVGPDRTAYHVAATQFAFLAPLDADEQNYKALLAATLHKAGNRSGSRFLTTTVIGIAPFILGRLDPRGVLRIAHSAAQDAREAGERIGIYSSVQDELHQRRFMLLKEFSMALEKGDQLTLVFQPRMELTTGACIGAEALLRWTHPLIGSISPAEFIPLVEQTEMARAVTAWVLEAALGQLAAWRRADIHVRISVNVSAANLAEPDLATRIAHGLAQHDVPAECLELEVTESAVMEDPARALALLETIAATGVRLAIDDFGTGHSSLSYLQRLPIQIVKIDQSFMRDVLTSSRRQLLVSTMISLSHGLGFRVVAEGVESEPVLEHLKRVGCDEAQGYLFGRPMSPEDFIAWRQDRTCAHRPPAHRADPPFAVARRTRGNAAPKFGASMRGGVERAGV